VGNPETFEIIHNNYFTTLKTFFKQKPVVSAFTGFNIEEFKTV
jgi:hypothetical protein